MATALSSGSPWRNGTSGSVLRPSSMVPDASLSATQIDDRGLVTDRKLHMPSAITIKKLAV